MLEPPYGNVCFPLEQRLCQKFDDLKTSDFNEIELCRIPTPIRGLDGTSGKWCECGPEVENYAMRLSV